MLYSSQKTLQLQADNAGGYSDRHEESTSQATGQTADGICIVVNKYLMMQYK